MIKTITTNSKTVLGKMNVILHLLTLLSPYLRGEAHPAGSNIPPDMKGLETPSLMEPTNRIPVNASLPLPNELPGNAINSSSGYRLPSSLKPVEYQIQIFPVFPGHQTFRGQTEIDLEVISPTDMIHLNMANLNLDTQSLTVKPSSGDSLQVIDHSLYADEQIATFTLDRYLSVGQKITFSVSYEGQLVNSSFGLNQISYNGNDGTKRRVLTTYMQPVGARHVFPCMDEPSIKAPFVLKIGAPKGKKVLSNMPLQHMTPGDNGAFFWHTFEKTVPMSTYLVAFVISDFQFESTENRNVKVWSRQSKLKDISYASSLAPKTLSWYSDYFGIPYVLPKLDFVTFPSYTVPGMENFGLITTEEASLTTNGKLKQKEWVATVTAHEVAHMWAGNLVTPIWWSQYWLSEGFATYFAALALNELEPQMEPMNHLIAENVQLTLSQDEGEMGYALVAQNFDPLVDTSKNLPIYFKGGAVLRMLHSILGNELFKKGIRKYFKTFQFKSASQAELYDCFTKLLQSQPSQPNSVQHVKLPTTLDEIMDTWTRQTGHPLITVSRTSEGKISVRQEVFEKKDSTMKPNNSSQWWIPISYTTSDNPDFNNTYPKSWLHPMSKSVFLEKGLSSDFWIIVNLQQMTFAQVNYDEGLWKAIADQLKRNHEVIHVLNRVALFHDAYQLFAKGHLDNLVPFLDLLLYLDKETSYFPLRSALFSLRFVETDMRGSTDYRLFKKVIMSSLSRLMRSHNGTSHMDQKKYELLLSWTCKFQDPHCTHIAQEFFHAYKKTNDLGVFPDSAKGSMLCAAISKGTVDDWIFLRKKLWNVSEVSDPKIKRNYIDALACSKNHTLIQMYIYSLLDPALNLTNSDARDILDGLARSIHWNKITWKFLSDNKEQLTERYGSLPIPFVITAYELEQVKQIFNWNPNNTTEEKQNLKYFIEDSALYAERNTRTVKSVSEWLHSKFSMIVSS